MWRRPRLQTLMVGLALVLLLGNFLGLLAPRVQNPCVQDIRDISGNPRQNLIPPGQGRMIPEHDLRIRGSDDPMMGNLNPIVKRGPRPYHPTESPTPGPVHFRLVTEMNSTIHTYPWPETKEVQKLCAVKDWTALGPLPDISVIVSFHEHEELFNILHTLHSVVRRTPKKLLREIILIDDNTRKEDFQQLLELNLRAHFGNLVRLVRSNVDLGLIRARLNGIRAATGKVAIVMDSHVETQPGWVEPLLYEIVKNRRTLATSYLDWMQKGDRTWVYKHGASSWKTYFDWTFTFGFQTLPIEEIERRKVDMTAPVNCPVTVGTVWAMDKTFFEEVGAFDDKMLRWGGENLDLAVRVWLFGGRVINVPCSHVSHLEKPGGRDYRNTWTETIHRNYKRFAEAWLGDYKKYFYQFIPEVQGADEGDIASRVALRPQAKHNFSWFLENVFPELGLPDVKTYAWGGIQTLTGNSMVAYCIDTTYSYHPGIRTCLENSAATQGFFWTQEGIIRLPIHVLIFTWLSNEQGTVTDQEYIGYHNSNRTTRWFHIKDGPIIETLTGLCLEVIAGSSLALKKCDGSPGQSWRFRHYSPAYSHMANTRQSAVTQFKPYLQQLRSMQVTKRSTSGLKPSLTLRDYG